MSITRKDAARLKRLVRRLADAAIDLSWVGSRTGGEDDDTEDVVERVKDDYREARRRLHDMIDHLMEKVDEQTTAQ